MGVNGTEQSFVLPAEISTDVRLVKKQEWRLLDKLVRQPRRLTGVMDVHPVKKIVAQGGDWGAQAPWELLPFKL